MKILIFHISSEGNDLWSGRQAMPAPDRTDGTEDSGQPGAPVRYVAATGTAPVISAGRKITGWLETTHNGKRCWIADLPEAAIGGWSFNRLYVNQSARVQPQLPKEGFYHFTGVDGLPDSGFHFHSKTLRPERAPSPEPRTAWAWHRSPQRWLKAGDLVTIEINRIGKLTNPVILEKV
jgi:2-keto-4-pentenoate hydratase/2-oxohepta-3-ene-1,7-dioic acid hydratase in catechol pathway